MAYDHIIIGSGLSALATAYGLRAGGGRILVIAGAGDGLRHYPGSNVPAANSARGGMGQYWHGVIPLSLRFRPEGLGEQNWGQLAELFYPSVDLKAHIGREEYFVPRQPIRPAAHFARLAAEGSVEIIDGHADRVHSSGAGLHRVSCGDVQHEARHIWLCAGALDTPRLLARSGLIDVGPRTVSDHVIGYGGMVAADAVSREMMRQVRRTGQGVFFPFRFGAEQQHFCTLRPARFDFATLDAGMEKRAIFGLPTSRVLQGLAGNMSPGLVSEALFNKFGLFGRAATYSAYFQTRVEGAYLVDEDGKLTLNPSATVDRALADARSDIPFAGIIPTRQPSLYIPGIHLHGTLSRQECARFGAGKDFDSIHIVDASVLPNIGPEHHSFAMMAAAYGRALALTSQN